MVSSRSEGLVLTGIRPFQRPVPAPRLPLPTGEDPQSRDVNESSVSFTRPVFLSPVIPGWDRDPLALPRAPHPAVTSSARRGEDRSSDTDRGYITDIVEPPRCIHSLRATSRRTRALRGAGVSFFPVAEFSQYPGLQERLHQRAHPPVLDPHPHPVHQRHMRDFIEAGFDAGFQDPLVIAGPGCKVVDLRDRVLRAGSAGTHTSTA